MSGVGCACISTISENHMMIVYIVDRDHFIFFLISRGGGVLLDLWKENYFYEFSLVRSVKPDSLFLLSILRFQESSSKQQQLFHKLLFYCGKVDRSRADGRFGN